MNGPEIFKRTADKLFPNSQTRTPKRAKTKKSTSEDNKDLMVVSDIIGQYNDSCSTSTPSAEARQQVKCDAQNVLLRAELENLREEMKDMKSKEQYQREVYSVMALIDDVICMETGLPNKQIFLIVVNCVKRFSAEIHYFYGWKVERI